MRQKLDSIFTTIAKEYVAHEALEGAVLGLFDLFTPEQLCQAIMEDIPIWESPWGDAEGFKFQFQLLARDARFGKWAHLLTAENVLIWLTDDKGRPLLASVVVNTPGGPAWLERQVEAVKSGLMEPIEGEETTIVEP